MSKKNKAAADAAITEASSGMLDPEPKPAKKAKKAKAEATPTRAKDVQRADGSKAFRLEGTDRIEWLTDDRAGQRNANRSDGKQWVEDGDAPAELVMEAKAPNAHAESGTGTKAKEADAEGQGEDLKLYAKAGAEYAHFMGQARAAKLIGLGLELVEVSPKDFPADKIVRGYPTNWKKWMALFHDGMKADAAWYEKYLGKKAGVSPKEEAGEATSGGTAAAAKPAKKTKPAAETKHRVGWNGLSACELIRVAAHRKVKDKTIVQAMVEKAIGQPINPATVRIQMKAGLDGVKIPELNKEQRTAFNALREAIEAAMPAGDAKPAEKSPKAVSKAQKAAKAGKEAPAKKAKPAKKKSAKRAMAEANAD